MKPQALLFLVALVLLPLSVAAQTPLTWEELTVEYVNENDQFVPAFPEGVQALAGQQVKIQGFMIPIDQSFEQQQFVLSAYPMADCYFCQPGGPDSMVEIQAEKPITFTYDPVLVEGTLEIVNDLETGMLYRLTGVKQVN